MRAIDRRRAALVAGVLCTLGACGGDKHKPIDAAPPPPPDGKKECTMSLAGTIVADQTVPAHCKVTVDNDVALERGTLTIEAGAVVSFLDGRSMSVGTGAGTARLVVHGSAADPVKFGSPTATTAWGQLHLLAGAAGSTITGLVLEHAGKDGATALLIDAPEITLTDSTIQDVGGVAIELAPALTFASFARNTLARTGKELLRLGPEAAGSLGEGNHFDAGQVIAVVPGTLSRSVTWRNHGAPYLIHDVLNVEMPTSRATLTLDAGVEVRFTVKAGLSVGAHDTGGLRIAGSQAAPVKLTSAEGRSGAWNLWVGGKGEAVIENADISFGGHDDASGAVAVQGGTLEVYGTTFHDNVVALSVDAKANLHSVDGCTFTNNSMFAIALFTQLGALGKNTYDDGSTIELRGGTINESTTWRPQATVWWSGDVVVAKGTLRIEAGSRFTMLDDKAHLEVKSVVPAAPPSKKGKKGRRPAAAPTRYPAQLEIRGTADLPVVLAGLRSTPGTWGNLSLDGEQDSVLEHVEIVGSGGAAAIEVGDYARVTLRGVACEQCAGAVVTRNCTGQVTLDGVELGDGTPTESIEPVCAPPP